MTMRSNKTPRPYIQAPAALRIGLPHLLFSTRPALRARDPRHDAYVRERELKLS
ncbi:hypothetical protein [Maricaulis maris]|uniref:hypothetical protein n=1 Tax=Maricaulis maris TaxID=74318 RepID=UPI003B8C17D6